MIDKEGFHLLYLKYHSINKYSQTTSLPEVVNETSFKTKVGGSVPTIELSRIPPGDAITVGCSTLASCRVLVIM